MTKITLLSAVLMLVLGSFVQTSSAQGKSKTGLLHCTEVEQEEGSSEAAISLYARMSSGGGKFFVANISLNQAMLNVQDFAVPQSDPAAFAEVPTLVPGKPYTRILNDQKGNTQSITIEYNGAFSLVSAKSANYNFDKKWFNCTLK